MKKNIYCLTCARKHSVLQLNSVENAPVPVPVKQDVIGRTELLRMDNKIRMTGYQGPAFDSYGQITKAEVRQGAPNHLFLTITDEEIEAEKGVMIPEECISLPAGGVTLGSFLVRRDEDSAQIVVYAATPKTNNTEVVCLTVTITVADSDLKASQKFFVTDKVADIVLDVGSDSSQALVFNTDDVGYQLPERLIVRMLSSFYPEYDPDPTHYEQYDGERLFHSIFYLDKNKKGRLTDSDLIEAPGPDSFFKALTPLTDSHKNDILLPNCKIGYVSDCSLEPFTPQDLFLKICMVFLHVCLAAVQERGNGSKAGVRLALLVPNTLTQPQQASLIARLTRLANDVQILNAYNILAIEVNVVSESETNFYSNIMVYGKRNGTYLTVDCGRSTLDCSLTYVDGQQVATLLRTGSILASNALTASCFESGVTWIELTGKERDKLTERLLEEEPANLRKIEAIAERKKKEYSPNDSTCPVEVNQDPAKLTIDKIIEILDDEPTRDQFGMIGRMITLMTQNIVDSMAGQSVDYLILTGRGFLFKPLRDYVIKTVGVKKQVFFENDAQKLKSQALYGPVKINCFSDVVGYPIAVQRSLIKEQPQSAMKIWEYEKYKKWKVVRYAERLLVEVDPDEYKTPNNYQMDEKTLKTSGVPVYVIEENMIMINRNIMVPDTPVRPGLYYCYLDGCNFWLRSRDFQTKLTVLPTGYSKKYLLEALFPWSLKLCKLDVVLPEPCIH